MITTVLCFLRAGKSRPFWHLSAKLTQKGADQATRVGHELCESDGADVIISSPLPHAFQTAEEIRRINWRFSPSFESNKLLCCRTHDGDEVAFNQMHEFLPEVIRRNRGDKIVIVSHEKFAYAFKAYFAKETMAETRARYPEIERGELIVHKHYSEPQ